MEKRIEKFVAYRGKYFVSYAVIALEHCYDADEQVLVYDLNQSRERFVFAHQLTEMSLDSLQEFIQCQMIEKYPDWLERLGVSI